MFLSLCVSKLIAGQVTGSLAESCEYRNIAALARQLAPDGALVTLKHYNRLAFLVCALVLCYGL
jgi:hypothetical protein